MQRLILSLISGAALAAASAAFAADSHDHGHDGHGAAQLLHLNNGSKWDTDESLRHGMHTIRSLLEPHLKTHGQGETGAYSKLAQGIQGNIDQVVQNCRLAPEADAVLHVILGDMFEGIALLEGKAGDASREQGVERVLHALENYGNYFNHPGWKEAHAH